jgi:hypothetical protein
VLLPCVLPKSQLLAIRTYSGYTIVSPRKLFESQYMDDTDKVPREGFPMRRLLRRKWGAAFHLQGLTRTTTLPARSS